MLLHIYFCHCSVCSIFGDYTGLGFVHYKELRGLLIARAIFSLDSGEWGSHSTQQQRNQILNMTHCIGLQTTHCKKESEKLQFSQHVLSIHNTKGEG